MKEFNEIQMSELLNDILSKNLSQNQILKKVSYKSSKDFTFEKVEPGRIILTCGAESDRVLVIVSGSCNVIGYSVDGTESVLDHLTAPNIVGFLEVINNQNYFNASIKTHEECQLINMKSDFFLKVIVENKDTSLAMIKFLTRLTGKTMNKIMHRSFNNKQHSVAVYLYELARGSTLPYTLGITRQTLSEILHINIRCLYRYVSQLKDLELLSIKKGKITINESQFKKLQEFCYEVVGIRY